MKHLFADTNVAIDFLLGREPFSLESAQLFSLADKNKITLYMSTLSFSNIYYILKKADNAKKAHRIVLQLEAIVKPLPVDASVLDQALHSTFADFEDALQHFSALSEKKIEAIVTRDSVGFKKSSLPVFTPTEALKKIS